MLHGQTQGSVLLSAGTKRARSLNNQISRKSRRPSVRSVAFSSSHPAMCGAKAKKIPSPAVWKIRPLGALAIHPAREPKRNTVASRLVTMEVNPTMRDEISWNTSSIAMRGRVAIRRGQLEQFLHKYLHLILGETGTGVWLVPVCYVAQSLSHRSTR